MYTQVHHTLILLAASYTSAAACTFSIPTSSDLTSKKYSNYGYWTSLLEKYDTNRIVALCLVAHSLITMRWGVGKALKCNYCCSLRTELQTQSYKAVQLQPQTRTTNNGGV